MQHYIGESPVEQLTPSLVLKKLKTEQDLRQFYHLVGWSGDHQKVIIPQLIPLLSEETFVGLTNSADLIIFDRIESGHLQSYGHGGVVADDLFVVAGRASYILKSISGSDFGSVSMKDSRETRLALQGRWEKWWQKMSQLDW